VVFPTLQFGLFFPVVFVVAWLLRPYSTQWKVFLVVASYTFYAWWRFDAYHGRYCLLLIALTLGNQVFALAIWRARGGGRRLLVVLAVVADLGVLVWFKYAEWLAGTVNDAWAGTLPLVDVILPIGVSFFVFQAISYVVDTYRRHLRPVTLLDFATYLSFFPHLVAGPIVRVGELVPQMERPADPREIDSARAFRLIMFGLAKKVIVAEQLATWIVKPVFDNPTQYGAVDNLVGVYAYAIQIYADFSGYTDIAIGLALLLGIRFPQNFNSPYIATTLQDFWRRWHMTLSRWLRDYLYIPLGGNRKGEARTCVNLFLTMFLGGIWHGASWTFVVWGSIHGAGLVVERIRMLRREAAGLGPPGLAGRVAGWLVTFNVVCLAWIFFRAPTFSVAFDVLHQILTGWGTPVQLVTPLLLAVIVLMLAAQWVPQASIDALTRRFSYLPLVAQAGALAVGFFLLDVLGPQGVAEFIYFQF
jgi:alginate O-acetyltransferase complex protein AlgI